MTLRHLVWRLREEFYPDKHPYDQLTGCDTSGMVYRTAGCIRRVPIE